MSEMRNEIKSFQKLVSFMAIQKYFSSKLDFTPHLPDYMRFTYDDRIECTDAQWINKLRCELNYCTGHENTEYGVAIQQNCLWHLHTIIWCKKGGGATPGIIPSGATGDAPSAWRAASCTARAICMYTDHNQIVSARKGCVQNDKWHMSFTGFQLVAQS